MIGGYANGEYVVRIKYDGNVLKDKDGNYPKLTDTEKQFAVVGNKLIIFPDKLYIDLSKDGEDGAGVPKLKNAISSVRYNFAFYSTKDQSTSEQYPMNQMRVAAVTTGTNENNAPKTFSFSDHFKVGDSVIFKETDVEFAGNKKGTILEIFPKSDDTGGIVVQFEEEREVSVSGSYPTTIETYVPYLDYICEKNNRLCGCSNKDNTIYVSALGEPFQLSNFIGNVSVNSFAVAVGSDGAFTGCSVLGSSVLFWKEDKLHKLLGEYASEYTLYSYDFDGVQAGSHKSQQVINETLFYLGSQGVYAYGGGIPTLISENFGQRRFKNGVAGRDTDSYYLSAEDKNGNPHLFVYETTSGLWLREDDLRAKDFARAGRDLYVLDRGGIIHKMDSGEADKDVEWMAYFTPFYETMQGRKTYSKLLIRAEIPQGAYIKPEVRYDGGDWKSLPAITGGKDAKNDTVAIPIPINRCDKFELRLSGKGDVAILGMVREFMVRSDK